jgi:prepilin signal peptidase PulO-like enzyme (type II secretory pathway)
MQDQDNEIDRKYKWILLGIITILAFITIWLGIDSFIKTLLGIILGFLVGKEVNG